MKKYLYLIAAMFVAVLSTSCLESGLEDLDEYSGCDITNGNVLWRWYAGGNIPASGEQQVKQVQLAAALDNTGLKYNIEDDCVFFIFVSLKPKTLPGM